MYVFDKTADFINYPWNYIKYLCKQTNRKKSVDKCKKVLYNKKRKQTVQKIFQYFLHIHNQMFRPKTLIV